MTDQNIQGLSQAYQLIRRYQTPRYCALDFLERVVGTKQYEHRPGFWDDSVPLFERSPLIADPIVAQGIASNVDLVLGEGRFPVLSEDDSDDDSDSVAALEKLVDAAGLKRVFREAFSEAQGCGTSVLILGVRAGKLFADSVRAKWCEPEFDVEGKVTKLTIQYTYVDTVKEGKAFRARAMMYRRVIDNGADTTFVPVELKDEDTAPKWVADPKRTLKHGFGFCPVHWYRHMAGISMVHQIDGKALHRLSVDEIEAHDFALSMRHRAALWLGEPQICEFGVAEGYNPTESGRSAGHPAGPGAPHAVDPSEPWEVKGHYLERDGGKGGTRKKGPGYVWQYANEKARVELLSLEAGSLKALDEHAADIRNKLNSAMAIVTLDPENIKFAATTSGKALETLKQRQLDRCDQYRDDLADGLIRPVVMMLIEIARKRIGSLLNKPLKEMIPKLADTFELKIEWGQYFKTDVEEQMNISQQVRDDLEANLITRETAVERIAPIYGISNVAEYVEELEEQKAEAMAEQAEMLHAAGGVMGDDADKGADPKRPGAKPRGTAPGGDSGAVGAPSKSAKRRQRRAAAAGKGASAPA